MTNRVLWSAVALVGLIFSSGCCCGPCGSSCGSCDSSCGLGMDLGGRYDDCNSCCGSSGGKTYCGQGCGERYWSAWGQRCDSCDCDGNFTGECCQGHFSWVDDCWMAFWGWQCCNGRNSCCDAGCHGGGCMGDNCPSGGWNGSWQERRGGGHSGGCASCGHGHGQSYDQGQTYDAPMSTPRTKSAPMRDAEPTPAPPKPSATSYRPQRNSVVTVAPVSAKSKTMSSVAVTKAPASNSVRQVQYESNPPARVASKSTTSSPSPVRSYPNRVGAEKGMSSKVPQSAEDFDLPPGAQIIKIEDNQ